MQESPNNHPSPVDEANTLPLLQITSLSETDLDAMVPLPLDLMTEYWSPEREGEELRLIFNDIMQREHINEQTGEAKVLPTATFYHGNKKDGWKLIMNASIRLVSALQNNKVPSRTPLLITYRGKQKNSTNNLSSDSWSIRPLAIKKAK